MTNKILMYWYKRFNKKYFSNKLPIIPVRFRKVKKGSFGETDIYLKTYEPVEIRIVPFLRKQPKHAITTMLHEMCHVSNSVTYRRRCGHGPKHKQELERLCKEGAYTRFNGGLL